MGKEKCVICGSIEFKRLGDHVRIIHKTTSKQYYDEYLKTSENEGRCFICKNETQFKGLRTLYGKFCSKRCKNINRWKDVDYRILKSKQVSAQFKEYWLNPDNALKQSEITRNYYKDFSKRREQSERAINRALDNPSSIYSNCKRGYFWSNKNNKNLYFMSSYELTAFENFENDLDIASFERCRLRVGYIFDNVARQYVPDITITKANAVKQVVEIKPSRLTNTRLNQAKFNAAREQLGDAFVILTEKDLKKK